MNMMYVMLSWAMPLQRSHLLVQPMVSQVVRELRQLTQLTQEQFAGQIGVSYETVSRWENGRMQPSSLALKQLQQIVQKLCESPDLARRKRGQELLAQYFPESEARN